MDKDSFQDLIDNIKCPICCLAMVPPLRAPTIIPECGHTACQSCISRVTVCPMCTKPFTETAVNITLQQIIENLNSKNLIPSDINPPPPSENKLLPKIEPLCTYLATGRHFIRQKSYRCDTCNISGNMGVCEVCASRCHKGHEVYLSQDGDSPFSGFFCDCPDNNCCQCCPSRTDTQFRCSSEISYGCTINQPMYVCQSCNSVENVYICQSCAIKCHHGHDLRYCGMVKGEACRCLLISRCKIAQRMPYCTYLFSGKSPIWQPWFHCRTCDLTGSKGCCYACARTCHKNHNVYFEGMKENSVCNCIGCSKSECKILSIQNPSYLTCCTGLCLNNKYIPRMQRMYRCLTCAEADDLGGICEACVINCHINHCIEFVGEKSFSCACKSYGQCQMMLPMTLHNNRDKCDRAVLDKDDVSPCYTCLTCDNSGNLKICETCALNNHIEHEIHILGYLKFECSEKEKVGEKCQVSMPSDKCDSSPRKKVKSIEGDALSNSS